MVIAFSHKLHKFTNTTHKFGNGINSSKQPYYQNTPPQTDLIDSTISKVKKPANKNNFQPSLKSALETSEKLGKGFRLF